MFVRYFNVAPPVIQQDSDTSEKSFQLCPIRQTPAKIWSECLWFNEESQEIYGTMQWAVWFDRALWGRIWQDWFSDILSTLSFPLLGRSHGSSLICISLFNLLKEFMLIPFPSDVWRMCDTFPPCTLPCALQCQGLFKAEFTCEGNSVEHKPRGKCIPWKGWTFII